MSSIDDAVNIIPTNLFNDLLLKPIKKTQLIKILDKYIFTYNYKSSELNVTI
jgi:hypothetical protein